MKTYAFLAILLLWTPNTFGQSCPPTAAIDGQEFSVVQLGSQCFYLDTRSEYLDASLTSIIGTTTPVTGPGISNAAVTLTDYAFSNYQYSFLLLGCTPTETISSHLVIGFEVEFSIFGIESTATGTVSANVVVETSYNVGHSDTGPEGTTFLQLGELDVDANNIDVDSNIPILDAIVSILNDDFFQDILLDPLLLSFEAPTGSPTIRKLNDLIIPSSLNVAIEGSPTICNDPITLTATPGFTSYLWSTGSQASSIVVDEPGTYSVEVTDNSCNLKEASITITQSNVVNFINVEPLCTGKVKLRAEGFASVLWSTGSESSVIEVEQSGSYSAIATDNSGCAGDDKVNLTMGGPCQPTNVVTAFNVTAVCSDFPNLLRRWKITNPNSTAIRMDWEIAGTIQKTWLDVPPGDSYLSSITVPLNQNLLKVYWHDEKGQVKSLQQSSTISRCQKGVSSSSIATSNGRFESKLKVFPNPTKDQFVLEVSSDDERTVPMQILSASGVVWYTGNIQLSKGQNFISNDISRFDDGAYVIKLGSETIRFMKE
jgi:hypothetical protein